MFHAEIAKLMLGLGHPSIWAFVLGSDVLIVMWRFGNPTFELRLYE
jgi:hypothetical protein